MKPAHSDEVQKILIMLQLDASRLMDRIVSRRAEYIHRFSLSRSRSHFPDIFENKYQKLLPSDLKYLSEELMVTADQFYGLVDNLYWYFKQTEDMGTTIEDFMALALKEIQKAYDQFSLYLKAEIRGEK
jgi:hypothetical protein